MSTIIAESLRVANDSDAFDYSGEDDAASAVHWPAVIGGAFVIAAVGLILMALGAGAGLSSLSPWSHSGLSPSAVGTGALVWLVVVQLVSSSLGGYLAGRLRTQWVNVHTHEVFFRDTAHGFLAWAVALVIGAAFLTTAATVMVGGDEAGRGARSGPAAADVNHYYIDRLFRPAQATVATAAIDTSARAEAGLIFARGIAQGELPADDRAYLAGVVAQRTGLGAPEADRRVNDVFVQDQQAVDTARKAVAHSLYWLVVALLVGAFSASWSATLGGEMRDRRTA